VSGPLRGVLLDFGGTLDCDGQHWSTLFAHAFAAAGLQVPREELDRAFLASDDAIEELPGIEALGYRAHLEAQARLMLAELGLSPDAAPAVAHAFDERARECLRRAVTLLRERRPRFRFGIVSNFTPNLPLILEEAGLAPLLDAVLCSALCGLRKPLPAIFVRALEELGLPPTEVAMIGDSLAADMAPAKQLGLTTIWIRGDRVFVAADERAADHVVSSFPEALRICDGLA
jgi:HAD superfamily hydrolase (TIGR01549 family)